MESVMNRIGSLTLLVILLVISFSASLHATILPGEKSNPVVAYDSVNDQYLAAYMEFVSPSWALKALVADSAGAVSHSVAILNGIGPPLAYDVAFDPLNERFLVVWGDDALGENMDIFAQLINANGTLYMSNKPIVVETNIQDNPSVAFDSDTGRYLVAWYDNRNPATWADIYCQYFDSDAAPDGTEIQLTDRDGNQNRPDVAYDSSNQRFLVVWEDEEIPNQGMIRASVLDSTGAAVRDDFMVVDSSGSEHDPVSAYDPVNGRYLVVWVDERNGVGSDAIYGQLVSPDGDLIDLSGTLGAENIAVSSGTDVKSDPAITSLGSDAGYVVVWTDNRESATRDSDVYGQLISGSGALVGSNAAVYSTTTFDSMTSIAHPDGEEFVMVAVNTGDEVVLETATYSFPSSGGGGGGCSTGPAQGQQKWFEIGVFLAFLGVLQLWKRRRNSS